MTSTQVLTNQDGFTIVKSNNSKPNARGDALIVCQFSLKCKCRNPVNRVGKTSEFVGCVDSTGKERIHPNTKDPNWRRIIDASPNVMPCKDFSYCDYLHLPTECPEKNIGGCTNCKYGNCSNKHMCAFGHNHSNRIEKLKKKKQYEKNSVEYQERQCNRDTKLIGFMNIHNDGLNFCPPCSEWTYVGEISSPVEYKKTMDGIQKQWCQETNNSMTSEKLLEGWCLNHECRKYHFGVCDYDGNDGKVCNNQYCKLVHRIQYLNAFTKMVNDKKEAIELLEKEKKEQAILLELEEEKLNPSERYQFGTLPIPVTPKRRVKKDVEEIVYDNEEDFYDIYGGKRKGNDFKLRISNKNNRKVPVDYDTLKKPTGKLYPIQNSNLNKIELDDTVVDNMIVDNFVIRDKYEEKQKKKNQMHEYQQRIRDELKLLNKQVIKNEPEVSKNNDSINDSEDDSEDDSENDSIDSNDDFEDDSEDEIAIKSFKSQKLSNSPVCMNFQTRNPFENTFDDFDDSDEDIVNNLESDSESESETILKASPTVAKSNSTGERNKSFVKNHSKAIDRRNKNKNGKGSNKKKRGLITFD
jgi:hypothetical protein